MGETMKQLELFAGIGGFGLAGHWAGIETIAQVEIDDFCQKVLQKNFPNAAKYRDIKEFDGSKYRGAVDIVSGGFPCQPYSTAGKRLGKDDERHLWPEMLRVIREVKPQWVVGENVRGLVSWSNGLVFEEVCADLETAGYEVQPFILPAASVGAPHLRYRIWFVAHSGKRKCEIGSDEYRKRKNETQIGARLDDRTTRSCPTWVTANAYQTGCEKQYVAAIPKEPGFNSRFFANKWLHWPTQPPVCGRNDGVSNRVDRIAALGNAIVPQVAYQIFKSIVEYEITTYRH
jgi:DNA (cytosine-5)-methyltransferase 1